MGWTTKGQCVDTEQDAGAVMCAQYPQIEGLSMYACTGYTASAGTVSLDVTFMNPWEPPTVHTHTVALVPCTAAPFVNGNPWALSAADGLLISGAVAACWSLAFVWRSLRKTVAERDEL